MTKVTIIELTPENAEAIGKAFADAADAARARLEAEMTAEQARQVRVWRVDEGCTWGRVGELWAEAYNERDSSQILGRELCYRAATLLGEDPHDDPWN